MASFLSSAPDVIEEGFKGFRTANDAQNRLLELCAEVGALHALAIETGQYGELAEKIAAARQHVEGFVADVEQGSKSWQPPAARRLAVLEQNGEANRLLRELAAIIGGGGGDSGESSQGGAAGTSATAIRAAVQLAGERHAGVAALDLGGTQLHPGHVAALVDALASSHGGISEMMLGGCQLGYKGAGALATVLEKHIYVHHDLTLLDLSKNQLNSTAAEAISKRCVLRGAHRPAKDVNGNALPTGLVTLELGDNFLGPLGAQALASSFGSSNTHNVSLTALGLRGNQLGEAGAGWVRQIVQRQRPLRHLDVSQNDVGSRGVEAICNGILDQPGRGLYELSLCGNGITSGRALGALFGNTTGLRVLRLSGNPFDTEGVADLGAGLAVNSAIEILEANHCTLGNRPEELAGLEKFGRGICRPPASLTALTESTVLFVGGRKRSRKVAGDQIANMLSEPEPEPEPEPESESESESGVEPNDSKHNRDGMGVITTAALCRNGLEDVGLQQLISAWGWGWIDQPCPDCTAACLTRLELDHNPVGDAGIIALVGALQTTPGLLLSHLYLADMAWGTEAALVLARDLMEEAHCCPNVLRLSNNPGMRAAGRAAVAGALRSPHGRLQQLELNRCHFDDAGAEALATSLEDEWVATPPARLKDGARGGVETLDLGGNVIGYGGLCRLGWAIHANKCLQQLHLWGNAWVEDADSAEVLAGINMNLKENQNMPAPSESRGEAA
jgi:hypothetical protein